MDPLERVNTFYTANPNAVTPADRLSEISGYFIYYEKNVNMHEYMLTNKTVEYAKPTAFVEFTPVDPIEEDYQETAVSEYEEEAFDDTYEQRHIANPEEVIRRHQANTAKRRGRTDQKRSSSLLASLCAVLFVVSFVMGVGLIRNQDRIDRMEGEIRQLVTSHRNLFTHMSNMEFAPVFAEANPPVTEYVFDSHVYDTIPPADTFQTIETQFTSEEPSIAAETPSVPEPVIEQPPPLQPEPTPPANIQQEVFMPTTYTIQPGDSLLAIALYFFGDANIVAEILELNGLDDPDHIVAGRTITLPQR